MRLLLAVVILLAAAPAAHAGGFATVGLSSTPTGTDWPVEITVLQHGRTPLDNVTPSVVVTQGPTTRTFAAEPTGRPGVYAAHVVFPGGGRWEYRVLDGFTDAMPHTFPAVTLPGRVASPASPVPASTDGGGGADLALLVPGVLALLAAPVLLLVSRTRRRSPEPVL